MSANSPHATSSRSRNRILRFLRIAAILYLCIILVLLFLENKIVFPSLKYPGGDWGVAERCGLSDVWFESADGTRLHGWLAEHENPRGFLIFCHGNAGNVTNRGERIAFLRDRYQLTTFVFDYRGYGRSKGSPNEDGIHADADAASAWLARHADCRPDALLLMGRSLGGAVAVDLAAKRGAAGLILESTFTSVPDAGAAAFPWLPVRWIIKNQFDAIGKIADYHGPLLVSHGTDDEIIPFELGRRLFDAAHGDKRFFQIDGGFHNDPQPPEYDAALGSFLSHVLGGTEIASP